MTRKLSQNAASVATVQPMRWHRHDEPTNFYLPSLLGSYPNAKVVFENGAFVIRTPDGLYLSEADLMEPIR